MGYEAVYLSAHFDDVVFSCGGQIAERTAVGERVLVVTVMGGDPSEEAVLSDFARGLHGRWALGAGATAVRRVEDVAACQLLGAEWHHLTVPDCIYRRDGETGEALYASEAGIFGEVAAQEDGLVDEIVGLLAGLDVSAAQVFAPLGVGHHVDHQVVRLAAERWRGRENLVYYEDYPYVRAAGALGRVIDPEMWTFLVVPLAGWAYERKFAAVAAYASQLSSFFADREDLEEKVGGYGRAVGGERLWYAP